MHIKMFAVQNGRHSLDERQKPDTDGEQLTTSINHRLVALVSMHTGINNDTLNYFR